MKKLVVILFLSGFSCVGDTGENVQRRERIIWLATNIASYIDSSPDTKYWDELDSFGAEAIPIVSELLYSSSRRSAIITVFAQLKGNDQLVIDELRRFVVSEMDNVGENNQFGGTKALYWLARKGNDEDIRLLRSLETHTNRFVKATAKSARIKLEQRLDQEKLNKQTVVSQPIHTPVPNGTSVVDKTSTTITTKEVVAPNVLPNPKAIPRKTFPYMVVIGGGLLLMIGVIVVATRKRKSGK